MRNHDAKFDAYECGEGNACHWIGQAVGALIGGGLGLMGANETADAQRYAADKNAENARPKYYGPGMEAVPGLLGDASSIYGQGGFSPTVNPLQLLGRQNQLGYAENTLPGLVGSAQESWMRGLNPGLDPYVGAMIESGQHDLQQDFNRNVLPRISDQAQAVGGYGGSRQGVAQGIASEALMEAQGDLAANLLSDAYGQSLGHQQAAWAASPQMAGLGLMPSQLQQDIGGQYQQDASQPAQNAQNYSNFLSPYFNPGGGFQSGYQAAPSSIGGAMQGALGGGLVGNWMSNAFQSNPYNVNLTNAPADVNSSLNNLWGGVIGQ